MMKRCLLDAGKWEFLVSPYTADRKTKEVETVLRRPWCIPEYEWVYVSLSAKSHEALLDGMAEITAEVDAYIADRLPLAACSPQIPPGIIACRVDPPREPVDHSYYSRPIVFTH